MDKSVIQALQTLIPAISGELPPELVKLACSILAQSRSTVSSLKAEEEIARPYACSHIACERLKKTLSLPKIEPRPPCPPRIYQKLYNYLEDSLRTSTSTPSKSVKKNGNGASNTNTPSKSQTSNAPAQSRSSGNHRLVSRSHKSLSAAEETFPDWVTPFTRRLCRTLGAPAAVPHVFAGASSILSSMKEEGSKTLKDVKLPALLVAVVFFVYSRLDGAEIEPAILGSKFGASREVVEEFRKDGADIDSLSETEIKMHIRIVVAEQGTRMEWFQNIRVGSGLGILEDLTDESESDQQGELAKDEETSLTPRQPRFIPQPSDRPYLKPGLGTMMQPKFDYMSEENLEKYAQWEAGIRRRILAMEQEKENQMDTADG